MRRAWPLLLALGCGPQEGVFEINASALSLADVGALQVAMLTQRSTVSCADVTAGCVKDQFPLSRFVDLTDASGATHKAVRFPLDGGIELRMAPGRDFALVIEALTASTPPQLAGSSCTYVPEITGGENRIQASTLVIHDAGVVAACDPTLQ